jgi:nicotinate-nucleotide--dimethylbenzimidazole phosphoribosyltransferase
MTHFASLNDLRAACAHLPAGDAAAANAVRTRQMELTKPAGSLGRLEDLVAFLATWQRRAMPRLERVEVLIFAGNHGVTAQGVSPFPPEVTAQMVGNFANGGAAVCQLAGVLGAKLRVVPLSLDTPTGDFTEVAAMNEAAFLEAVNAGYAAVSPETDLLCLGEMGIGNTTPAAAIAAALFGGTGVDWAGRGTGVDDAGLARKIDAIDRGLQRHPGRDPLEIAANLGGRELAAILGATVAARTLGVPVLLDGFVCTAAAAPLSELVAGGLDHAEVAHASAESGHRRLIGCLGKIPVLDLGMRLGEGSGAAVAALVFRAAVACHTGMATFAEAAVSGHE